MAMEKYGVEKSELTTYEVVKPVPGKPDDFETVGSDLSLDEANELREKTASAIVRPE